MSASARPLVAAAALGLMAALASCGGEQSAEEYRAELDGACAEVAEQIEGIPQRAKEEDLTAEEGRRITDDVADEFASTVEDLDPPPELADSHDRLVDKIRSEGPQGEIEEVREYTRSFGPIYDALGARECSRRQQEALDGLEGAGP
ncbi:hypothetical protein BH20ACT15_BH20ACT15_12270 [soil metagenome]